MSVNVKALRALLDDQGPKTGAEVDEIFRDALPDLLALAESVRELAPHLTHARYLSEPEADAARRVLAILDTPRAAGDGR